MNKKTLADRFWAMVDRGGPTPQHSPKIGNCWIFTGHIKPNGYGQMRHERRGVYAHHVAFRVQNGEIYEGYNILHECDNRSCVRGSHLIQGTQKENLRQMVARGRHVSHWGRRTHCKNGHLFSGEKRRSDGARNCKICARDSARKYRSSEYKNLKKQENNK